MAGPFVSHPLLQEGKLEDRAYQASIVDHALRENLLVVMPTGLGKTAIALRAMARWLERYPGRKALLLAPTRPLVEQHARTVRTFMATPEPVVLTGTLAPARRTGTGDSSVVVATPQVVLNDVQRGALHLEEFSMVIFDEAHRARGDYPYVGIARGLRSDHHRILGITASPGSRREQVEEVLNNLHVEPSGLEFRDEGDPDVLPYLHEIGFDWEYVEKPRAVEESGRLLRGVLDRHARALASTYGPLAPGNVVTRTLLLEAGRVLAAEIAARRSSGAAVAPSVWQAQKHQAAAMKVAHALELLETQGPESLARYVERMRAKGGRYSPSTTAFLRDPDVVRALELAAAQTSDHPKVAKAVELVRRTLHGGGLTPEASPSKVIVFTHYRDMADVLVQRLTALGDPAIRAARFVGQATHGAGDPGLSQREQVRLLDDFRAGKVNCLVATSVAEEGLDVPATDLVVFYEPVPSEIRTIQRRGRTGRSRAGRVVVLLTKGTQDVGSFYAARGKEHRMRQLIEELKGISRKEKSSTRRSAMTLDRFT